jgi:hypothetical protein
MNNVAGGRSRCRLTKISETTEKKARCEYGAENGENKQTITDTLVCT